MTERERVFAAARRDPVDEIPWQFDLTRAAAARLRAWYGVDDLIEATGDHIAFVSMREPRGGVDRSKGDSLGVDHVPDEFGVVWRRGSPDWRIGDWGGLVSYPLTSPSLGNYEFPDGAAPGRWANVETMRKRYPDRFLVAVGVGIFERAWSLCGFQNYLSYVQSDSRFVEEVTERLADFSVATIGGLVGKNVDGIRIGDDWGFQDQLIISPDSWRRIYKPSYKRIFDAARSGGLVVMMHSCGNITGLLADLIEIGLEVIHPVQPEAMDLKWCKREYGADIAFWGGLGSQSTLPLGSRAEVVAEVRNRLDLFSDGGYILAPAGAAPAETPAENIAAIVETARSQQGCKP